jgi:hypothetical protein
MPKSTYHQEMHAMSMDLATVKRIIILIIGFVIAYLTAEILSAIIVRILGLTGAAMFIVSLILWAAIFFAVISLLQRVLSISFFDFDVS